MLRVQLIVALIAVTGASGLAVAMSAPVAPMDVPILSAPPEAVLVLAPEPSAPAAQLPVEAPPAKADLDVAALVSTQPVAAASVVETIAAYPRHLLLPDGALVSTLRPAGDETPLDGGIVLRALPALAPEPAPPALARPSAAQHVVADDATIAPRAPLASPSSPETSTQAGAFVPSARAPGGAPTFVWSGAALGAVALLGVALYHRIRPNAALENETRKVIFAAVCAQPGLGVHEISKLAGVSYSTTTYHLERLVAAGMLVMTPDGNKLCYYKNGGAFTESERRILPLLKNEEAAKLFEAILHAPGTYRAALAEKLGVTATTINWHLRRLREAGLVDETRAGRSAHLFARTDALRPTLLALASKVEPSEPSVAEKLRAYARVRAGESASAGAA